MGYGRIRQEAVSNQPYSYTREQSKRSKKIGHIGRTRLWPI